MENLKNKDCLGLPHFCSARMQTAKPVRESENKTTVNAEPVKMINKQKPWSVFEDVYWI
ncbi:MAG TPA: hypothetical protein PL029_01780 [Bacteroidia bacterium]|nr:hypothetical protein [Bacteroidia bacterium]